MTQDTTTFFLAFTAVFGGIGYWLWRMQRTATALAARLEVLETTNAKQDDGEPGPRP